MTDSDEHVSKVATVASGASSENDVSATVDEVEVCLKKLVTCMQQLDVAGLQLARALLAEASECNSEALQLRAERLAQCAQQMHDCGAARFEHIAECRVTADKSLKQREKLEVQFSCAVNLWERYLSNGGACFKEVIDFSSTLPSQETFNTDALKTVEANINGHAEEVWDKYGRPQCSLGSAVSQQESMPRVHKSLCRTRSLGTAGVSSPTGDVSAVVRHKVDKTLSTPVSGAEPPLDQILSLLSAPLRRAPSRPAGHRQTVGGPWLRPITNNSHLAASKPELDSALPAAISALMQAPGGQQFLSSVPPPGLTPPVSHAHSLLPTNSQQPNVTKPGALDCNDLLFVANSLSRIKGETLAVDSQSQQRLAADDSLLSAVCDTLNLADIWAQPEVTTSGALPERWDLPAWSVATGEDTGSTAGSEGSGGHADLLTALEPWNSGGSSPWQVGSSNSLEVDSEALFKQAPAEEAWAGSGRLKRASHPPLTYKSSDPGPAGHYQSCWPTALANEPIPLDGTTVVDETTVGHRLIEKSKSIDPALLSRKPKLERKLAVAPSPK